jgi:hypothetical protein
MSAWTCQQAVCAARPAELLSKAKKLHRSGARLTHAYTLRREQGAAPRTLHCFRAQMQYVDASSEAEKVVLGWRACCAPPPTACLPAAPPACTRTWRVACLAVALARARATIHVS